MPQPLACSGDPVRLTARERGVIALVADGKTDAEIAIILGVAAPTARFHVDNVRRKLRAVNRAHAVARYILDGHARRADPSSAGGWAATSSVEAGADPV